jgi:hypothetical protein
VAARELGFPTTLISMSFFVMARLVPAIHVVRLACGPADRERSSIGSHHLDSNAMQRRMAGWRTYLRVARRAKHPEFPVSRRRENGGHAGSSLFFENLNKLRCFAANSLHTRECGAGHKLRNP